MPDPPDRISRLWKDLSEAESQHLSYSQIEAYVDSRLESTEAELVRAHTELCSQCAAELRDLQLFAESMRTRETQAPERIGWWARLGGWLKTPQPWVLAGAAAALIIAISVVPRLTPPASAPPIAAAPSNRESEPVEAFLEPPPRPLGAAGSKQFRPAYRVLSPAEASAYRAELAQAPSDPEIRAAIAIKYALYSEAEYEYQKMISAGGAPAEKGRRLMDQLNRLRAR